jgi:glyoxylase-like metal-dependent hydrolase (beta-lactamase superfamily II)
VLLHWAVFFGVDFLMMPKGWVLQVMVEAPLRRRVVLRRMFESVAERNSSNPPNFLYRFSMPKERMTDTFPKVHIHTSSPDTFFVNSFIIEGVRSLVLVDTQFVLSEVSVVTEKIAALQKPLAAVLITHPHPDHYNGLASILEKHVGTQVYATAGTISGIRETAEPKRAYWAPIIGSNYPQRFAIPGGTVRDGEHLSIDGIELVVDDFGAAECSDNTAIELPQIDAVIISDLVYNRVHPWLAEGRSDPWLKVLAQANRRFASASVLYAGHGAAGSPSIINEQAAYIQAVREMVASAMKEDRELSDASRAAIQQRIRAVYEGWPLEMIIDMNTTSLAGETRAHVWDQTQP